MLYRHALTAAVALALLSWLLSRGWRRLPLFGLYLAVQLPLLVGFRPEDGQWLQTWWVWMQPALQVMRMAATGEAFWAHAEPVGHRRRMGTSLLLLSVALVALVWTFVPSNAFQNIQQARRLIQIGCAAFLLLYVVLMWAVERLGAGWRLWHVLLFLGQLLLYAVVSVASMSVRPWGYASWYLVDGLQISAIAVLMVWWALMWWRERNA